MGDISPTPNSPPTQPSQPPIVPFPHEGRRAWVTLITSTSYIPGVILLAHSLKKHGSAYPLLILYTSALNPATSTALLTEALASNFHLLKVEPLVPAHARENLIAERFRDTWTKLRVFELVGWERLCWLDADMLVMRNVDEVFETKLDEGWIAANHVCVCNLDRDSWAPPTWKKENCAWVGTSHPGALKKAPPVPRTGTGKDTHRLLNGGFFLFEPNERLWKKMCEVLNEDMKLKEFMFPDQDFLAYFFENRWKSFTWWMNALKTWRYWHPEIWRDEEVGVLHYIVDKPWNARVRLELDTLPQVDGAHDRDGGVKRRKVAGYLGNDGETHSWWWATYEEWRRERKQMGGPFATYAPTLMDRLCAKPLVDTS